MTLKEIWAVHFCIRDCSPISFKVIHQGQIYLSTYAPPGHDTNFVCRSGKTYYAVESTCKWKFMYTTNRAGSLKKTGQRGLSRCAAMCCTLCTPIWFSPEFQRTVERLHVPGPPINSHKSSISLTEFCFDESFSRRFVERRGREHRSGLLLISRVFALDFSWFYYPKLWLP